MLLPLFWRSPRPLLVSRLVFPLSAVIYGFVGAQPGGFPYGRLLAVSLVVCGLCCVDLAVLAHCVLLWCVLSVWLWGFGFGSGLGSRVAGTWAGMALAGGRCGCAASVMSWSVGAAGWAASGERGWERGALHDPIVFNDS